MSTIGKLALALSKVQGELEGAKKDSANPFFKSKYADLTSVWDACRELLSNNELCVIQTTDATIEGITLVTTLAHSSGEFISGKLFLKPVKGDPQSFGSALTYARRYALAAIVGISPEDDDGNAASRPVEQSAYDSFSPHVTDKQLKLLYARTRAAQISPETMKNHIKMEYKKESANELTQHEFNKVLDYIQSQSDASLPG